MTTVGHLLSIASVIITVLALTATLLGKLAFRLLCVVGILGSLIRVIVDVALDEDGWDRWVDGIALASWTAALAVYRLVHARRANRST